MTQHYTKNTVEASAWCKVCSKETPHSVFGGRLGSCLSCIKRLGLHEVSPGTEELKEPEQMTLMERYGVTEIA